MPIVPDSSTPFANEPLVALLKRPLHQMTQEELQKYTLELRTLQKSPQALGRKLRQEAKELEDEEDVEEGVVLGGEGTTVKKTRMPKAGPTVGSVDDLMKELGG